MLTPVVWVGLGSLLVVHRAWKRRKSRDLHKLPAFPSVPILGCVGVLKAVAKHQTHLVYTEFSDQAGPDGVIRIDVLGRARAVVTTPATFAAIFRKQYQMPKPMRAYSVFRMLGAKRNSMLNEADPTEHSRIRKLLHPSFSMDNIARTVEQLSQLLQRPVASMVQRSALEQGSAPLSEELANYGICWGDVNSEGMLVNAKEFGTAAIMNAFYKVFLHSDNVVPIACVRDCIQHASLLAIHPLVKQLVFWGILPGRKRARTNFKTLHSYNSELLRELYARPMPDGSDSEGNFKPLWAGLREAFPNAMTNADEFERAAANLGILYFAGFDTTAHSVSHTLTAIALDKEWQSALAEELQDAGLVATAADAAPRTVTAEDVSQLHVLDALVHESLRLMPTAPVGGLRELPCDTQVGKYLLPKGLTVLTPPWCLHHNTNVWGPDANQWRPDRWLEAPSVHAAKKDDNGLPRFLPFLDGRQNCIGQHLALTEIKVMVATIISQLEVSMDTATSTVSSVDEYISSLVTNITLQTPGPCWLRMKSRAAAARAASQ